MWLNVEENPPPKDRLIEVTSGIAWVREDEFVPALEVKGRIARAAYTRKRLRELGNILLVYWAKPPKWCYTHMAPEGWLVFNGGIAPQDFKFWRPFVNPLKSGKDNYVFTEEVPDVETMPVYVPSEEEIKNRQIAKMLGF